MYSKRRYYGNFISLNRLFLLSLLVIIFNIDKAYAACDPLEEWDCDDGQCIDGSELCDGVLNCKDGTDEIPENCMDTNCPEFAFRCAYGGCITGTYTCNGQKDCVDNSDENPMLCNANSHDLLLKWQGNCTDDTKMQCGSGECIEIEQGCDGIINCDDGSDETVELCSSTFCPPYAFRCGYGGCINGRFKCNGNNDCPDGSDEAGSMCGKPRARGTGTALKPNATTSITTTTTTTTATIISIPPENVPASCQVPVDCSHLLISTLPRFDTVIPGSYQPKDTIVTCKCESGYSLQGELRSACIGNIWKPSFPRCTKYCNTTTITRGYSTESSCHYKGDRIECNGQLRPGTIANISCSTGYTLPSPNVYPNFFPKLTCGINGEWDHKKVACNMKCGTFSPKSTTFAKNGRNCNITAVPYHVGIYSIFDTGRYEQICGGSIISATLVISAAHCFWDTANAKTYNENLFAVGAGKYYRDYYSPDEFFPIQKRNISKIVVNDYKHNDQNYRNDIAVLVLDAPLRFGHSISPICVHFPEQGAATIDSNLTGSFAGWGITEGEKPSTVLQTVATNTLSFRDCTSNLKGNDTNYELPRDKFCLINVYDGTACRGDSGGGFVMQETDPKTQKQYYRLVGVISNAPLRNQDCAADGVVAMTNVQFFESLIIPHLEDELRNS